MSKEFETVHIWPCRKDIDKKLIAQGINSIVFKVDNYALKVYPYRSSMPKMNIDKLRLYGEVTKETSRLLKSEKWTVNFPFPLGQRRLEVNCFMHIAKCDKCGYLEAWMPFVSGVRLDSPPYSFFSKRQLKNRLSEVGNQIERRLGVEGIEIDSTNIKSTSLLTCVITDLCYDITSLDRVDH